MTINNITFTAQSGCLLNIDGWPACIESKAALLMQGVCIVTALNAGDAAKADDLMTSPCGQDGAVFGCNDPRLVELAARHYAWLNDDTNAPWADTAAAPLSPLDAAMAFQQYLNNLNPA